MKNNLNQAVINEFKERINQLSAETNAKWGKMDAYQMLKHCTINERMNLGMDKYPRLFFGRLFGKSVLKVMTKDDSPLKHNQPTHPKMVIKENGNLDEQKAELISLLEQYPNKSVEDFDGFLHPFFGKMTSQEFNISFYKHMDHHLRQFGV